MISKIVSIVLLSTIILYDIVAVIFKVKKKNSKLWDTISGVWNKWYKQFIFLPYAVGVTFVGHFDDAIDIPIPAWIKIAILIILSVIFLVLALLWKYDKIQKGKKFYKIMCRFSIIPILIGYVVGELFWSIS